MFPCDINRELHAQRQRERLDELQARLDVLPDVIAKACDGLRAELHAELDAVIELAADQILMDPKGHET